MFAIAKLTIFIYIFKIVVSQGSDINTNFYDISPRVIGGSEIKQNGAPFMISIQNIQQSSSKIGKHYCGGVILDENWILTAAHCLPSDDIAKKSILVAGAHDISIDEKTIQIRKLDFVKKHKLYNGGTAPYDIALIYTKVKIEMNKYVQKISLPVQNSKPNGQAMLYGWGSISMNEIPKFPNKLYGVNIPIIGNDECKLALGAQGINLHNTNLCTGPLSGGKGICQADSGGPLVQMNTIIGIVSWGKSPCGQINSPSIFVQVSAFIDWIKQVQKDGPK